MTLARYICSDCGLSTRCEQGEAHRICNCDAPYIEELEDAAAPPVDPQPEPQ